MDRKIDVLIVEPGKEPRLSTVGGGTCAKGREKLCRRTGKKEPLSAPQIRAILSQMRTKGVAER